MKEKEQIAVERAGAIRDWDCGTTGLENFHWRVLRNVVEYRSGLPVLAAFRSPPRWWS